MVSRECQSSRLPARLHLQRALDNKVLIGITIGDPCGIGPEVTLRSLARREVRALARFIVFGSAGLLRRVEEALHLRPVRFKAIGRPEEAGAEEGPFLIEPERCDPRLALRGRPTAAGGRAAAAYIAAATQAAMRSELEAIVTAPISKEALHLAGLPWSGHTEMLAALTGTKKPVMMMTDGCTLAIALVTTHAAIAEVPRLITRRNVLETIRIVNADARRLFGLRRPRIVVTSLNPHAGEGGLFGREESRAILPAVLKARREGIACEGPVPADAAFVRQIREGCDVIVAMFHDQATIPIKALAFDRGVNTTLGLPIIRTSPDHGTAYDIVKQGRADAGSMVAAIRLAARLARLRRRVEHA